MFHVKHFVFMETLIISHYVKRLSTRFPQLWIVKNVSHETLQITRRIKLYINNTNSNNSYEVNVLEAIIMFHVKHYL